MNQNNGGNNDYEERYRRLKKKYALLLQVSYEFTYF